MRDVFKCNIIINIHYYFLEMTAQIYSINDTFEMQSNCLLKYLNNFCLRHSRVAFLSI